MRLAVTPLRLGQACALLLAALAQCAAASALRFRDFEFPRLNRSFRDLPVAVEPVEADLLRISLTSPRHEVVLLRHRLRLRPLADGTHDAELWAQFQGTGRLVADVSALGFGTRLQDDVALPLQEKLVQARLRIARSKDGYLFTPLTLPRKTDVKLKSRLGADLVGWCNQALSLVMDCGGLGRALSSASIPLPAAGETYLLANEDLTPEDRRALDDYLAGR